MSPNDLANDPHACLERLQKALCERGLVTGVRGCVLTVANPAVPGPNQNGARLSPGLGQKVLLGDLGDGLSWYWIWPPLRSPVPGAKRQDPEIQFMCGADKIDHAAHAIARVVRLCDDPPADA